MEIKQLWSCVSKCVNVYVCVFVSYLFRCSHKVDSCVVAVVFLQQAEGELVVDQ